MQKIILTGFTCCLALFSQISFGSGVFYSNPTFGVLATQSGLWSVMANPAGTSIVSSFSAGVYYDSPYLLGELSTAGFSVVSPLGNAGVAGVGYKQFGYSLYKEQHICGSFARQFGKQVSAAVRFDYKSVQFGGEYGSAGAITGSAGVLIHVSDPVRIGVSVFNPSRVKMSRQSIERIPVEMLAGVAWSFGTHAEISAGIELNSATERSLSFDFIYNVTERFKLVCGISGGNNDYYFGYSFGFSKLDISMLSGYNELLGFSPQFSLVYKKK